jgi:hypothetical protein
MPRAFAISFILVGVSPLLAQKEPPEPKTVSAVALTRAFLDDKEADGKKYGNLAPVVVEGEVKELRKNDAGESVVYLKGATDKIRVACSLDPKGSGAGKLKAGDKVMVAGAGYGLKDGDVALGFCQVITSSAGAAPPPGPEPKTVPKAKSAPPVKQVDFIRIARGTDWSAVPATVGTPAYINRDYKIAKLPKEMKGAAVIQRAGGGEGDTGFLKNKVTLTKTGTLYVAIMWKYNGDRTIQDEQFEAFAKEGWTEVDDDFELTVPEGEQWKWRVWSRKAESGPLKLESTAIPVGGIFFFKP